MAAAPNGTPRRISRVEPHGSAQPAGVRPARVLEPGDVLFGRYRLEARLVAGATSESWRAVDQELAREVVVRILNRQLAVDERSRERFAGQARAIAGLSHPGVVGVHDVRVEDGLAAVVVELVEGTPLSDRIAEGGPLPQLAAAAIAAQVAEAIQAAHDRGLIHRDVQPGNVLLSADGRARLVDFGVALGADGLDRVLASPGMVAGSLRYMAPEQLAGQSVGRASDVYGLGALLFEMLAGVPPYRAETPASLGAEQRIGPPGIPGVDLDLAGIARMALDRQIDRRPRSAAGVSVLLKGWLNRHGVDPSNLPAIAAATLEEAAGTASGLAVDDDALGEAVPATDDLPRGAMPAERAGGPLASTARPVERRRRGRRIVALAAVAMVAGALGIGAFTGKLTGWTGLGAGAAASPAPVLTPEPSPTATPTSTPTPTPAPTPTATTPPMWQLPDGSVRRRTHRPAARGSGRARENAD